MNIQGRKGAKKLWKFLNRGHLLLCLEWTCVDSTAILSYNGPENHHINNNNTKFEANEDTQKIYSQTLNSNLNDN